MSDLENKWKKNLSSILEELDSQQYKKTLLLLDKIPKSFRGGKAKENIAQKIIEHYGAKESIIEMRRIMDAIPRRDHAVQVLLKPFKKINDQPPKKKKAPQQSSTSGGGGPQSSTSGGGGPQSSTSGGGGPQSSTSGEVQTGKIKITKIIRSAKAYTQLEADINQQKQKFRVTNLRLAKAFGVAPTPEDGLKERLSEKLPVSAEVKTQGNIIKSIKRV